MTYQELAKLVVGKRKIYVGPGSHDYAVLTKLMFDNMSSHDWHKDNDGVLNCTVCGAYLRGPWNAEEKRLNLMFFYPNGDAPPCSPTYCTENVIKDIIQ